MEMTNVTNILKNIMWFILSIIVIGMCVFGLVALSFAEMTAIVIFSTVMICLALTTTTGVLILRIVNLIKYKK